MSRIVTLLRKTREMPKPVLGEARKMPKPVLGEARKMPTPVLGEARKMPTPVLGDGYSMTKPALPTKGRSIGDNYADPGDTGVGRYNALESAVQNTEIIDSTVSNAGAASGATVRALPTVARFVPSAMNMAPALNMVRAVGTRLAPIQAGLWGVDAIRAVGSPEYRGKTLEATQGLLEDPSKSGTRKTLEMGLNTLARPISTTGSMIRSYQAASDQIREASDATARSEEKQAGIAREKREKKWRQGRDDLRSYIQQVARESALRNKFAEPVALPREDYTPTPTGGMQTTSIREIRRSPLLQR